MNAAASPMPAPLDVFSCPLDGVNLIEASAGTGKTWTICGLYLRLLLEKEFTVQQILVVTFTNAATAELRERIRARILDLRDVFRGDAVAVADRFIGKLADDLLHRGMSARDITARLELALSSFDEAAIFTIHGFCQRALADNPFTAGLPLRNELLASDHDLLMEVVHDFWRRHVAHAAVTPEFARYLQTRGDSPAKYAALLARHLAKPLARVIWPADLHDPPLSAALLLEPYREVRSQWMTHKLSISALLGGALSELNGNSYKPDSLRAAALDWDLLCRDDDALAPVGKKACLLRAGVLSAKTNKKRVTPTHPFFTLADSYLALRDALERSQFLTRCRLLERLFIDGPRQLQRLKRSRRVMVFNDMLANLHERLEHADYPRLAPAIARRFPAALIDEFQDTDPLQLAIFRKIYVNDESLVFLVGDPKQAIYSFRHADLHSYLRAKRWAGRCYSLTDNQRASQPLLAGLNRLFGGNNAAFVLPEVPYQTVAFGAKPRTKFVDRSVARAPLQVWRLPDSDAALWKSAARHAAVDATAAEIARLLQAGLDGDITLDARSLRPGDIAVLVRSRALGDEVKRALARLNVGAVELSRDSIFDSPEAQDWHSVLVAIASPTRDALLLAALATELFGRTASQIEQIAASDKLLSGWLLKFLEYRDLWVNRGFGIMYRRLLTDQDVAKRLLGLADGERRLTNCLHVGEELQNAAQSHVSPEALLRCFMAAREEENPLDTAQLRLESDENLVQIVTIHTCKGLEYPIVFCPFLCDGITKFGSRGAEGHEYHDPWLLPVIDFRYANDDPALEPIKAQIKLEQAAETVRLMYVALTRAMHRCYLVTGPYQTRSPKDECARSMLNWLVAGQGSSPQAWLDSTLTTRQLDSSWAAVAAASGGGLGFDPLPTLPGVSLPKTISDAATLSTPSAPRSIAAGWRLSSYSGLNHGARGETAAGDHDARTLAAAAWSTVPDHIALDDILRFPRGPDAGNCIHAIFEHIDFTDRGGWPGAIAAALASHPLKRADDRESPSASALNAMLSLLLANVAAATLRAGLKLAAVPMQRRLTELEFNLPVRHLSAVALNSTLKKCGYEVPSLTFGTLQGYLKGFIDLVFEHEGQYFIVDWKSNHLGYTGADYSGASLAHAMAEHGYHLQYLLYSLALDRYLKLRVRGYRFEAHFGGVFYLFVRGIRPAWRGSGDEVPGVFSHRPEVSTIRALDDLFEAPGTTVLA